MIGSPHAMHARTLTKLEPGVAPFATPLKSTASRRSSAIFRRKRAAIKELALDSETPLDHRQRLVAPQTQRRPLSTRDPTISLLGRKPGLGEAIVEDNHP